MIKSIFIAVALIIAGSVMAQDYSAMTFLSNDGSSISVSSDNLELTIESQNLVINHSEGQISLPLSGLNKFYFSESYSGVDTPISDSDADVVVYSIMGHCLGTFPNTAIAREELPSGVYIFKTNNDTFKILK